MQELSHIEALQEESNTDLSSTHPHIPISSAVHEAVANLQQTTKIPHLLIP